MAKEGSRSLKSYSYSPEAEKLLKTNVPPTSHEEAILRASLSAAQAALADTEKSHASVNRIAAFLVQFIVDHKALLSTFRRIPTETLYEILRLVEPNHGHMHVVRPDAAPWNLTWVCRQWRDITLSCKEMWSSKRELQFGNPLPVSTAGMSAMLDRSGSLPLSVGITLEDELPSDERQTLDRILDIFVKHSERWVKAVFDIPESSIIESLGLEFLSTPILEHLYLRTSDDLSTSIWPLDNIASMAPRLRTLEIPTMTPDPNLHSLPWQQLTSCQWLPNVYLHDDIEVLNYCENLTTFSIPTSIGGGWEIDTTFAAPTARLTHLTSLEVPSDAYVPYIECLTTPSLHTLLLIATKDYSPNDTLVSTVARLLIRSNCDLRNLALELEPSLVCSRDDIIAVLRACPHLRRLAIRLCKDHKNIYPGDAGYILTQLGQQGDVVTLFPQLDILELSLDEPSPFALGPILLDVVNPRRSVLKHLYLSGITEESYDNYDLRNTLPYFAELEGYGVKIEWVKMSQYGWDRDWPNDDAFDT